MNVDDVVAAKIAAARRRAEEAKRRRAALNAARQRGLAHRHAQRLRNQASARMTDGTVTRDGHGRHHQGEPVIPANRPAYVARYRHHNKATDTTNHSTKPVVAWDDDKVALVVDEKTGRLVDASSYSNFAGLMEDRAPRIVATMPGGGWMAEYRDDDGTTFSFTVVAWNVKDDGDMEPACVDRDGFVSNPTQDEGFVRLFHPSEEPPAPAQSA
ncbi:hypothetical protein [Streptomyces sp. DH24]|uniref:hypothetical protein n=1 Tax=Streptomyces sp. DH24 TaxID=3040123 RepID=UPI00244312A5|nr:hypothetical protein [Streptomyces sp. DH24]MDG9717432.1 hypothetical protein [Streptomyces sp. DH24]